MKAVECYHCENCKGIKILQYLVVDKQSKDIIQVTEEAVYKCDIFDTVHETDECYEFKNNKDITNNVIEWTMQ